MLKKYQFAAATIALATMLNGCQTLSQLFPGKRAEIIPPTVPLQSEITKHEFDLTGDQALIGGLAAVETQENDTLPDIARHFGLGYNDITAANAGISPYANCPQPRFAAVTVYCAGCAT